ncbi:MAG: MaoC family dehydratase [Alphaproteobacteria bacterium]|nr:MaoC family dehydratase [Alphaproteobacteria bacterium]
MNPSGLDQDLLYYEDFVVDEPFETGQHEVTAEEIIAFASEYDPLPFHVDEDLAAETMTGGLIASGWHVLSMQMKMIYDGILYRTASMGSFGLDDVRWIAPVRPGNVLTLKRTALSKRVSKSRPEMGIIQFKWEVYDQTGELKSTTVGANLIQTRASVEAG